MSWFTRKAERLPPSMQDSLGAFSLPDPVSRDEQIEYAVRMWAGIVIQWEEKERQKRTMCRCGESEFNHRHYHNSDLVKGCYLNDCPAFWPVGKAEND